MANNEASFQTELLDDMRKAGFHAFKVSKLSFGGVPDLYVKALGEPGVWIELKFRQLNLTELQKKFIRDERKAGGKAGWALCVPGNRYWTMYAGYSENFLGEPQQVNIREVGGSWNVYRLLETIIG